MFKGAVKENELMEKLKGKIDLYQISEVDEDEEILSPDTGVFGLYTEHGLAYQMQMQTLMNVLKFRPSSGQLRVFREFL